MQTVSTLDFARRGRRYLRRAALAPVAAAALALLLAAFLAHPARAAEAQAAIVPDWGAISAPAPAPARAIGGYARGCLGGAVALPAVGTGYQVMRLSRKRYYGHPELIAFIQAFAKKARADGWPGLLVGDMAQPRGGPILTGHASHQIGLDADIWFTPAPARRLSADERETMSATSMVAVNTMTVDRSVWSSRQLRLLRTAASFPEVERIFVNPAIKRAACAEAGKDRAWLAKIRPWWGHTSHFHVRLRCPPGDTACLAQEPLPAGDGCDSGLDWWFSAEAQPKAGPPATGSRRRFDFADLPPACRGIFFSG
ncbi:MAG: penicillin-insensitive murein endopeptidase [Rhodospirillales bacterium]|nr:penicillin-insensitive murein endopeptidase [Rhodospirillales bacterium]